MIKRKRVTFNEMESNDRGHGKWLMATYTPVSLFSLRMTHSTSSGGKTLFVPTPYTVKMAMIDAGYRVGGRDIAIQVFEMIKGKEIKFKPPAHLTVNHTFIKIKRRPKVITPELPYNSSIAFREFCFFQGDLEICIGVNGLSEEQLRVLVLIMAHISYFGKRGSFFQFKGVFIMDNIPEKFSLEVPNDLGGLNPNIYGITQFLDDFGAINSPDLFERLNVYSSKSIELNKHRVLKQYFLPYRQIESSKHYTYYRR